MTDVVCPNCHSVTPPLRRCLACNCFLGDHLDNIFENAPATSRWSLSHFFARTLYEVKRLLTSSGSLGKFSVHMDGHLRRDCRRVQKHKISKLNTSSTNGDEVAVIAKVDDLDEFTRHVNRVTTAVKRHPDDKTALVTARIQADENKIEWLRNQPYVKSLKAATRIRPFLEQTRREIFSDADLLQSDHEAKGGGGVIVGIVDFGLDFAHRNFRTSNGRTRILALWDQKASCDATGSPMPFGYGRLFEENEINRALAEADPYKALGYEVAKGSAFDESAHGTFVADVAAGNGQGTSCPGVAPEANIVFVDISTMGTPPHGQQAVGSTFGDCAQLLEAIQFIFAYAKDRPCVINISLGTNGGPHDGTTPVEEAIDWLLTQKEAPNSERVPNRAIVIAAGNSFGRSLHATGRVPDGGSVDLKWRIPSFDATSNELEVWYSGCDRFTVDLIDPDGNCVRRIKPGRIWEKNIGKNGLMTVVNRLAHPNNKDTTANRDNTINVFFERGVRDGVWTLRLRGDSVRDGRFHAWIERDDHGQSMFAKPKDKSYTISNECTLNSIACGHETIVVGSYNAYEPDLPMSEFSSSGPTRDNREQPTVCAPGENVLAAESRTLVLRHRRSGTSISAAVVTGTVALMLSEAKERKITADQIRRVLIRTARKDPSGGYDWDPGFGYGRVRSSAAAVDVRNEVEGSLRQSSAASSRSAAVARNEVITSNGRKG